MHAPRYFLHGLIALALTICADARATQPTGWFQGMKLKSDNKLYAFGWAYDPDSALAAVQVQLCLAISPYTCAVGVANLASADITQAFGVPGNHRFELPVPISFYNKPYVVHVLNLGAGSNITLYTGNVVVDAKTGKEGWAYQHMTYGTGKHAATIPAPQSTSTNSAFYSLHNALKAKAATAKQLVFLGDSITELWEWDGYGAEVWDTEIEKLGAANYGLRSDATQNVLWRLENGGLPKPPKLVVLMIGVNNIALSQNAHHPKAVYDGVKSIVTKLLVQYPSSRIMLLGILPTQYAPTNTLINTTNSLLKGLVTLSPRVIYRDYGPSFLKGTVGNADYYKDTVHIDHDGYKLLWSKMKNEVLAILGAGTSTTTTGRTHRSR